MTSTDSHVVELHTREYHDFRARLLGLYESRQVVLGRKSSPWDLGTTWGYWLKEWRGVKAREEGSAASIGEDEMKLFFDFCQLVRPESMFVIGNSFGLSTLCLALAAPEGRVVSIDNWSDPETASMHRPLCEAIIAEERLEHVHMYSGSSPHDTAAALAAGGIKSPLSLAFIDALHRDDAASADFGGLVPFLDERSIVLWHNVHLTSRAFRESSTKLGRSLLDQQHVLRTHGPLGIYFSSRAHPHLAEYLKDGSLIWREWERYVDLLCHEQDLYRFRELSSRPLWKLGAAITRPLRRGSEVRKPLARDDAPPARHFTGFDHDGRPELT
jgi:predicted O-methyltransferase YrrM